MRLSVPAAALVIAVFCAGQARAATIVQRGSCDGPVLTRVAGNGPWDGRTHDGRAAPDGTYVTRATGGSRRSAVVVLRRGRARTVGGRGRPADGPGTAELRAAVRRLVPGLARCLTLRVAPAEGEERLRVASRAGRVELRGSTRVAVLHALRVYVEQVLGGQISREASRVPGHARPPLRAIRRSSPYAVRYTNNFTVAGYTTPWWDWAQWERELDVLALSGITAALVLVGQEAALYDTLRDVGYGDAEARDWLVLPAHQPWQWLGQHASFGPAPSLALLERRADLGRRVLARMRALGIEPVVPGFAGTVPADFALRVPGAVTIPQLYVNGLAPPALDPASPAYRQVARRFYAHQRARFGPLPWKAVNLFHEQSTPVSTGGAAGAARAVEATLREADPGYRWVLEAWRTVPGLGVPEAHGDLFDTPPLAGIEAVDRSRLLLVDLTGEAWREREAFRGAPWVRSVLTNFGGRRPLYGPLPHFAASFPALLRDRRRGALSGLALTPEGFDTNPVVWDFLTDLAWRRDAPDPERWVHDYARRRYGADDPDARRAWSGLLHSVYARDNGTPGTYGGADSLLNARPSLTATRAGSGAPPALHYDPAELEDAWRALLAAAPRLGRRATFRFDLVDVTRQVLADRARVRLPRVAEAFRAGDADALAEAARAFVELLDLQERLLATTPGFLLGPWLRDARSWATSDAEAADFEFDARSILTIWAQREGSLFEGVRVDDYANRDWAGLTGRYYRPRWAAYLAALEAHLRSGGLPIEQLVAQRFDPWAAGEAFSRDRTPVPVEPVGDAVTVAREVAAALSGRG